MASLPWGAAAQEEPESIVVEVPEPEAEPLDVLDDQVGAFGGGVGEPGAVPAQDGCLSAGDGPGDPFELGDLAAGAVVVEGDEASVGLEEMTAASIENCRLGARELMLVRVAALVAVDALASSYVMNIGAAVASDSGVTIEYAQDLLVAVAPIGGTTRVMSAVTNMGEALGFTLGSVAQAEADMDADEG